MRTRGWSRSSPQRPDGGAAAPREFGLLRHPPERGLQYALYSGSCCTTCCCCCCCCAHSVGGVVGTVVAQRIAVQKYRVSETTYGESSPIRTYWHAMLVMSAVITVISFGSGLIALVFLLPLFQLFASAWTWFAIRNLPRPQWSEARSILRLMTTGGVVGAVIGGVLVWLWLDSLHL